MDKPVVLPSQKIITLLEANGNINNVDGSTTNGTFQITLDEQLVLKENDSINVMSAFVDTTSTDTNFITVDEETETEITITHGMYFTDSFGTAPAIADPVYMNRTVPMTSRPDNKNYILQNQVPQYLETQLVWTSLNNPNNTATPFHAEMVPTADVTTWYGYTLALNPVGPRVEPLGQDLDIIGGNLVGMRVILANDQTEFYFKLYAVDYTPPVATGVGINDHIATLMRWVNTATNDTGFKATQNQNTTYNNPTGTNGWNFKPANGTGYQYFSDNGSGNFAQLGSLLAAWTDDWTPVNTYFPPALHKGQYPAIKFNYYGQDGNEYSRSIEWSEYGGKSGNPSIGAKDMLKTLGNYIPQKEVDKAPAGAYLPRRFTYYRFTQYQDPRDTKENLFCPKLIFDTRIGKTPWLSFFYPSGADPITGLGSIDTGWMAQPLVQVKNGVGVIPLTPWNLETVPIVNPTSSGTNMTPRTFETKITIPSGKYTFDGLAQTLTDTLNAVPNVNVGLSNNPDDSTQALNLAGYSSNRLLQSTYELSMQYIEDSGVKYPSFPSPIVFDETVATGNIGKQPFWLSEDGNDLFQYIDDKVHPFSTPATVPRWCGTQTLSIIYDDTSNQFKIAQAHAPIYGLTQTLAQGGGPAEISIRQLKGYILPADAAKMLPPLLTADKVGGIFITDMQPASLFQGKMDFNPRMYTSIAPVGRQIKDFKTRAGVSGNFATDTTLEAVQTHTCSLIEGVNITGSFVGGDSLISKVGTAGQEPDYRSVPTFDEYVVVDTPITLNGDAIIPTTVDDPFFQIEISGITNSNIYGQSSKNNLIQSIVPKYYSSGNFTESTQDNSFQYTHKGADMVIRNLNVRILNSLGQVQEKLGPSSAIILELNTTK